jgi:hypothetical protein
MIFTMKRSIAFLLQTNYIERVTAPVGYFAQNAGYDIIDCSSSADFDVMNCGVDWSQYDLVIPYGSIQFIRLFMESPLGAQFPSDEHGYSADFWMEKFGALALNHGGLQMIAGDVLEHLEAQGSAHVRPTSLDKALIARLFTPESWQAHCAERHIPDNLDVFVSKPKVIEREYRCWVIEGKVLEIRGYMINGKVETFEVDDPEIYAAAQALADVYVPSNAVVMDMAKTQDGFKFLEFNRFHSSGWYGDTAFKIMGAYVEMLTRTFDAKAELPQSRKRTPVDDNALDR